MKSTSPRWKTFWRRTRNPIAPKNQWCAWTRSRSRCTPMSALRLRPSRGGRRRRDNEYERCGTANVFCAVEPKAGRHFTFPTPDRSAFEFAQVVCQLALQYPEAKTIHLVMDNLNIHRRKSLTVLWRRGRRGDLGPLHCSLHSHTRKLAQPGRNRNRHVLAPMPRKEENPRSWDSPPGKQEPGIGGLTGLDTKITGNLTAGPPVASSATTRTFLSGQRPSVNSMEVTAAPSVTSRHSMGTSGRIL